MNLNHDFSARKKRVNQWFAPARLGIFFHWGFFTGGGLTSHDKAMHKSLRYRTVDEFEAAAPDPEVVAENMVATAKRIGAKYINYTCMHCNGGYGVMFPTEQEEFVLKTEKDYLGALIEAAHRAGLRLMIYMMMSYHDAVTPDGVYLKNVNNQEQMRDLLGRLVAEIGERYDKSKIGGFWLDGGFTEPFLDFPAHIKSIFPDAMVTVNCCTFLEVKDVDFGTLEFVATEPVPVYNRPSGGTLVNSFGVGAPPDNFIEDIPHCESWWYWDEKTPLMVQNSKNYLEDPDFLLHEMISSIGQRGQWNYVLGIPVRLDGTVEEKYDPMFQRVEQFLSWGSEAVYNTRGGIKSPVRPGSFHGGGFCSVTQSLEDPDCCYILITDPPSVEKSGFFLQQEHLYGAFDTNGREPVSVEDLRTKQKISFTMPGGMGIYLEQLDWSDVREYGVKVLKVRF
ncbi:MAG: alpha-L-fucosidase [Lentisphaeria bacterium]|nr:alpha-L-fucosidase [Lentisphaeria bacterium]